MICDPFYQKCVARCQELARAARDQGEPAVGAVIACRGAILAEAFDQVQLQHDVTAHAEMLAIRAACRTLGSTDLAECTLVTSVEPCWMCGFAIRETRLGRILIGTSVAEIGAVTSRFPLLADPMVEGWGLPPEIVWWSDCQRENPEQR